MIVIRYESTTRMGMNWFPSEARFEKLCHAKRFFASIIPSPEGGFGPILYRNITLSKGDKVVAYHQGDTE